MSLINQPIDPNNQPFINKLHHLYQKKSSQTSMSSYPKQQNQRTHSIIIAEQSQKSERFFSLNPIKNHCLEMEKKWQTVEQELQNLVRPFAEQLKQLLATVNIGEENRFYKLLELIRKNQLLSDVAQEVNEKIVKENFAMKKEIEKLKQTLTHLSKTQREKSKSSSKINSAQVSSIRQGSLAQKIDPTRSLPQNIFLNAKLMKEDDFVSWCDKILMKNKVVITDMRREISPKKSFSKTQSIIGASPTHFNHQRSLSAIYDKDSEKDHPQICQKHMLLSQKIQQLSPLIQPKIFEELKSTILSQLQLLKQQKLICPKFCCSLQNQKLLFSSQSFTDNFANSGAKLVNKKNRSRSNKDKGEKDIYRDKKMEEYFNRYYKQPGFKMDQVKSVEQTKGQEMNRLENQYFKMLQQRSKLRYGY